MTDLDRLIAAVEAGKADAPRRKGCHGLWLFFGAFEPSTGNNYAHALDAYRGSLDAALALKDALLPKSYGAVIECWGTVSSAKIEPECGDTIWADSLESPARALLLATLRAYAATQKEPTP